MSAVFELVCFDMAGTTVLDDGLVLEAFRRTIAGLGVDGVEADRMETYVVETMGQSKIEVFTVLFGDRAEVANLSFERHFTDAVRAGSARSPEPAGRSNGCAMMGTRSR